MKKMWEIIIIVSVIVLLFILWMASTSCGKDVGYGAFEKYRCKCAGFIAEDIFEIPMFDSTTDYRCYGVKIGKTELMNANYDYHLIGINKKIKSIETEYGSKIMLTLPSLGNICFFEPNSICFDKKCQIISNFSLESDKLCLEDGEHQVIIEGRGDHTLITKSK
jgi:hypothetical protein